MIFQLFFLPKGLFSLASHYHYLSPVHLELLCIPEVGICLTITSYEKLSLVSGLYAAMEICSPEFAQILIEERPCAVLGTYVLEINTSLCNALIVGFSNKPEAP